MMSPLMVIMVRIVLESVEVDSSEYHQKTIVLPFDAGMIMILEKEDDNLMTLQRELSVSIEGKVSDADSAA